ncbi:hypothetical protein [Streptomyces sp. MUM 178J]|uniref:hypothetical protein n=1 Tax=Streptomyces sp. MUM 178J TaxID=2791991 RepID=UPI001F03FB5D|nr:hypothetical protein [Streptomyces sp. MUM 178J]WRQ82570.1 hypothetical protein I3F59_026215 [Streptomyces sp. MUM 178J]
MSSTSVVRAGAGLRLLRAAVFTAVCVALSATGHALAACAAVPWWTLPVGFLFLFVLVAPFAGRERSLPSIAAGLSAGQLALHALFGAGQHQQLRLAPGADDALIRMAAKLMCGAGASSMSAADARRIITTAGLDPATATAAASSAGTAQAAHPTHTLPGGALPSVAEAAASPELMPSLPMLLGHLLAALATGWLLRRGDLALCTLARLSAGPAQSMAQEARLRSLRAALTLVQALRTGLRGAPAARPCRPRPADEPPVPASDEALQHTVIRRGPPAELALAA